MQATSFADYIQENPKMFYCLAQVYPHLELVKIAKLSDQNLTQKLEMCE